MSKKIEMILIISLIVITVTGIVLGTVSYFNHDRYINEKTITVKDGSQTEMAVSLTDIHPGESAVYSLNLRAGRGEVYNLELSFEKGEAVSLAPFIDVAVRIGGEPVGQARLSELLEGKSLAFKADFHKKTSLSVELVYSMDLAAGDEAQGTVADFTAVLYSKR